MRRSLASRVDRRPPVTTLLLFSNLMTSQTRHKCEGSARLQRHYAILVNNILIPEVAEQILACISAADERTAEDGERYRGVNPTRENIEAGLTTLVEQSMGAVCQIGALPIDGCLEFSQEPPEGGLYFMDTPFFSPVSLSGMAASGAQLTLFSLGVFNPSGNPLVPNIKVCGNTDTLATWDDSIDVSVSGLLDRSITLDEAAEKITAMVMKVASGQESRAEYWGEGQVIVPKTRALI